MLLESDTVLEFPTGEDTSPASRLHHATAMLFGLPAIQHGALAHLAVSIDHACSFELKASEKASDEEKERQSHVFAAIKVACDTISLKLENNTAAWAPVIFEWSLKVLGEVSYHFGGASGEQMSDRITFWRSCESTSSLMDVTVKAMAFLMKSNPFSCVDSLLEAVRALSPHLDWMLALTAGMFSSSLIPALLRGGLKSFHHNFTAGHSGGDHRGRTPARKPNSRGASPAPPSGSVTSATVQILTHLLARHADDIHSALVEFFKNIFVETDDDELLLAAPYLLHLVSECPQLLELITKDLISSLTPQVTSLLYDQYCKRLVKWSQLREEESFRNLLKQLRSDLEPVFLLLFELATPSLENVLPASAQDRLRLFLEHFINDLQFIVLKRIACLNPMEKEPPPVFLLSLQSCDRFLLDRVLPVDIGRSPCSLSYNLLVLTGLCAGETWCANLLMSILVLPPSFRNHSLFVDLHQHFSTLHISVLDTCLTSLFSKLVLLLSEAQAAGKAVCAMQNLKSLCIHERDNTFSPRCTMELRENLAGHTLQICQYIRPPTCNFDMRDACLSLLSELPCLCASPSYKASLADASTCARSLATCYSHLHGDSTVAAMNGFAGHEERSLALLRQSHTCCTVMSRLAEQHVGMQSLLLRLLTEGGMAAEKNGSSASTVGTARATNGDASNSVCGNRVSLLESNYRHTSTSGLVTTGGAAAGVKAKFIERRSRLSTDSVQTRISTEEDFTRDSLRADDHYTRALCAVSQVPAPSPPGPPGSVAPLSGLHMLASVVFDIVASACGVISPPSTVAFWTEEEALRFTQKRHLGSSNPFRMCETLAEYNDITVLRCLEEHRILWQALFLVSQESQTSSIVSPILRCLLATQLLFWQRWKLLRISGCRSELRITQDTLYLMSKAGWLPKQILHSTNILPVISPEEIHSILSASWSYLRATSDPKSNDLSASEANSQKAMKVVTEVLSGIASENMEKTAHFYHLIT